MAISPITLFEPVQLLVGPHTYYTADFRTRIDKLTCANISAAPRLITIYWVPAGSAVGDPVTIIVPQFTLAAKQAIDIYNFMGHIIDVGDMVGASVDAAAAVNFFGSGTTVS